MININSIYIPDNQESLKYHRDLLKIAALARLAHEAKQTNPDKPSALSSWDWLRHLFPARRQHNRVAHPVNTAQVRS